MIRKVWFAALAVVCMAIVVYGVASMQKVSKASDSDKMRILVVYNPKYMEQYGHILTAYASVLEEEGVAFETIDQHLLLAVDPTSLADKVPAVIFPDGLCQRMPIGFEPWIADYLSAGGGIALIYDPAVKDSQDAYLASTFLKKFSAIDHIAISRLSANAYTSGEIRFVDQAAARICEIPYGKLDAALFLSGYQYGRLQYPVAHSEIVLGSDTQPAPVVLAHAVVNDTENYPAIATRRYGKGLVFYVNLPLGYLKAHSDDLPLRSMLRFFLFRNLGIPHMMNVPFGKGGIVFNWHHDTNGDWPYLEQMIESGFFRSELKYSMHITAGDSDNQPGDGDGFDACGQGERFVQLLKLYGTIGSHGGWYHNWFAANIESEKFTKPEIEDYIRKNNRCLESVTGEKISEYSAPNGAHPQPLMTQILSEMGIVAYYYTGDSGSAPNRSFFEGRMLSDRMVAFPVMPFSDMASLVELKTNHIAEPEVRRWLHRTVDYAMQNRTVRLLYSHPYDLFEGSSQQNYRVAFSSFLDYLEQAQAAGRIDIRPMSFFADFLLQMLESTCHYIVRPEGLEVHVLKRAGLKGLTLALPTDKYQPPDGKQVQVQTDTTYYYVTMDASADETRFLVPYR